MDFRLDSRLVGLRVSSAGTWTCLHGRANTALAVAQARASATPSSVGMSETRLADESIVEFCGLQGRADLNGKRGMVKGFVAEKDRYAVVVASGQPESRGLSST